MTAAHHRVLLPLIFLSGIVCGLVAFTPYAAAFFSPVAYIPFIILFRRVYEEGPHKGAFLRIFIFSSGFYIANIYWIYRFTVAGIFLVAVFQALFVLLQAFVFSHCVSKRYFYLAFPLLWTFTESIKQLGPLGYTWNAPGYALSYFPPVASLAYWGGVTILTFAVLSFNVLIFRLVSSRRSKYGYLALILAVSMTTVGYATLHREDHGGVKYRVSVIQPSIDLFEKWDEQFIQNNMEIYYELGKRCDRRSRLVVWPETAFSAGILWYAPEKETVRRIITEEGRNASHLIGSTHYDGGATFNSLFLVDRSGSYSRYDKIKLLPVAEYLPFDAVFGFLRKIYPIQYDLSGGKRTAPFMAGDMKFTGVICFESMFGNFVDRLMSKGSQFLVVSTNDGWFERTPAPRQHLQMAVMRAIEGNTWVIHCANSGISAIIDNKGRILKSLDMGVRDVMDGEVAARSGAAPYSRTRRYFDYYMPLILLAFICWRSSSGKKSRAR